MTKPKPLTPDEETRFRVTFAVMLRLFQIAGLPIPASPKPSDWAGLVTHLLAQGMVAEAEWLRMTTGELTDLMLKQQRGGRS